MTISIRQLRPVVLAELDDQWRTPTELRNQLGLGGSDWYRLCLTLERLANDGLAELRVRGNRRRFRRRQDPTS